MEVQVDLKEVFATLGHTYFNHIKSQQSIQGLSNALGEEKQTVAALIKQIEELTKPPDPPAQS